MRRIQTLECKLSILIAIIISFIFQGNIMENGNLIEYGFGFPCEYLFIHQGDKGTIQLFGNLFNGNKGMNINILAFFVNIVVFYVLILFIEKIYKKINSRGINK